MGIRPPNLTCPNLDLVRGHARRERRRLLVGRGGGPDCDPDQPGCVDIETAKGNCWSGNSGPDGGQPTADPPLAACRPAPASTTGSRFPNINKLLELLPCATWDPQTNTDPPGCDWFTPPPEPN